MTKEQALDAVEKAIDIAFEKGKKSSMLCFTESALTLPKGFLGKDWVDMSKKELMIAIEYLLIELKNVKEENATYEVNVLNNIDLEIKR